MELPSYSILAQEQPVLDAPAFHHAKSTLEKAIAKANKSSLLEIYQKYHGVEPESRDPKIFGQRHLKNIALSYLAELGEPEILDLVSAQYFQAKNMTDRMVALSLLADSNSPQREQALNHFHTQWKNDSVVINKWFTVQASAISRPLILEDIKMLTKDVTFNINNPNNVYSLLRTFGSNLVRFHDPKFNAYEFYAERILEIDEKNPQVAARLCAAFNFVNKLDAKMKDRALTQIRRLVAAPNLSKNSRELLESALK
jgi:aminopeptidase N